MLTIVDDDIRGAWSTINSFGPHHDGPGRDAARLAAFKYARTKGAQIGPSNIVAVVWDNAAHTEQQVEPQSGLEAPIKGATIVPRCAKMRAHGHRGQ